MKSETGTVLAALLWSTFCANAQTTSENERHLAELREQIRGREDAPAKTVFKSLKLFADSPASRVLRVMDQGYTRALGVSCLHCHVTGDWASEEKPQKQVAREMVAMVGTINLELLKKIKGLSTENPLVNCTTCHRGQVKPALELP